MVSMVELEHKAGIDLVYELALRLYPSSMQSFREAISNLLDEGANKIEIQVSINEIILEGDDEGIKDLEQFRTYGQYTKANLGGAIIGMKGLGKLSLLRLGKLVEYRTNNGEYGRDIFMTPKGFKEEVGSVDKFLKHRGTRVIIPNPDEAPPIDELSNYLKKIFGLRIAKGTQIYLNGALLDSKIDADENFLFKCTGGIDVCGNLKQSDKSKGTVDVYIRYVFTESLMVDIERSFSGWVNCNELIPTTARTEIVEDKLYYDFLDHLREYVARHFAKRDEEISQEAIRLGDMLSKLLKDYLLDMKIYPEGSIPLGKGEQESLTGLGKSPSRKRKKKHKVLDTEVPDYVKIHMSKVTNKPIKRCIRTDYGIVWLDQGFGNEYEPVFFIGANEVVRNITNDIYKFALKDKYVSGKWLIPYLSRMAVSMNKESKSWSREQTNLEADKITRYFLEKLGQFSHRR